METTIDGAGRLVVPKALRERLGLTAGATVVLTETEGGVEIRPRPIDADVVRKGGVYVVQPREPLPPTTDGDVRRATEAIRAGER